MINLSNIFEEKIDKTLDGITSYFSKKAESLTNGFVRSFSLSPSEKLTFINDIFIDRCYSINDVNSSTAPTHNLDNNSIIAETVIKEPVGWTLNCKFTSQDHKEKFEKLLEIQNNVQLVTLLFNGRIIENLVIINIGRTINNVHYTEFTISLVKLNFVTIQTIPAPKMKKVVSKSKSTVAGKRETSKVLDSVKAPYGVSVKNGKIVMKPTGEPGIINVVNGFDFKLGEGGIVVREQSGGGAF